MAVALLVRHGRTAANADGILAGWTPGVHLDEKGREQAERLGQRLAPTPLVAVVSSPLERCRQTAEAIQGAQPGARPARHLEDDIGECRYGAWTGGRLKDLADEPLWREVQERPSTVLFPPHERYESESMTQMRDRAVRAVRAWDERIEAEHGPGAVWAAVSHGDVIKALLSWFLGSPLDRFQRIVVDPASVSIVRQSSRQPFVLRVNDTGTDPVDLRALSTALTKETPDGRRDDAAVGGGAGSD
ncbi:MSMEG_4193 family putative phosphomutase [Ornithinimicrobium sp. F0845]|uniref:MSMEG_4193 family putative phosphomutase n=1 Tax=Ornithinimicrobium sp. F0845 TaxID=2926412 RepID=UPI001FF6B32A|nr:MSMEG_4193 family putative phosphomutase [Ornithinimicrobium sp. F0845]MCK0113268.1 MSMEG_4193 family putative phosphomutase [Ornithinimicrobium sp. F0845]